MKSPIPVISGGCFAAIMLGMMMFPSVLWGAGLLGPQGDLVMADFGYTEYDSGVKRWTLQASDAKHSFDGNVAEIETLRLQLFSDSGAPDTFLRADSGVLKLTERTFELIGDVEAKDSRGYRFSTEQLYYDDRARIAHGKGPIVVESEGVKITGQGFDYVTTTGVFRIHKGVEALIAAPLR